MRSRHRPAQGDDSAGDKDHHINGPHVRVSPHGCFDLLRNLGIREWVGLLDLQRMFALFGNTSGFKRAVGAGYFQMTRSGLFLEHGDRMVLARLTRYPGCHD